MVFKLEGDTRVKLPAKVVLGLGRRNNLDHASLAIRLSEVDVDPITELPVSQKEIEIAAIHEEQLANRQIPNRQRLKEWCYYLRS